MNNVKNNIKKHFTVIPNSLINDITISSIARFLFVYMASKPDDWDFYQIDLMNATGIKSPRTFRIYAKELIETGWISRSRTKTDKAQFSSYDYTLNEKPGGKNCPMEPGGKNCTVEKLHSGKIAPLSNKDFKQRNTNNKEVREDAPTKTNQLNSSPEIQKEKIPAKRKVFQKPTVEQVADKMAETLPITVATKEAITFVNYYEANGWKVGRNKMQSWPHAVGGWISRMDSYKNVKENGKENDTYGAAKVDVLKAALAELNSSQGGNY